MDILASIFLSLKGEGFFWHSCPCKALWGILSEMLRPIGAQHDTVGEENVDIPEHDILFAVFICG
jgi:hypothetical protein